MVGLIFRRADVYGFITSWSGREGNRHKGSRVKEVSGLIFRKRRIYVDLLLLGQEERGRDISRLDIREPE